LKILKFDINKNANIVSENTIEHLAFAGISIDDGTMLLYIHFECIDNTGMLIDLEVPMFVNPDELEVVQTVYEGCEPRGLIRYNDGTGRLVAVDLFRKQDDDTYSLICVDANSSYNTTKNYPDFEEVPDVIVDNFTYFKMILSLDQYILIYKYISDVMANRTVSFYSVADFHLITKDSNHINLRYNSYHVNVVQVDYPEKTGLLIKKYNNDIHVLLKFTENKTGKFFYSDWPLEYDNEGIQEIMKNKKYKPINIDEFKDHPIYVAGNFIACNFAINADNPMQQTIIFAYNVGTVEDKNDVFITISSTKTSYISFIEDIYEQLTKIKLE
jgi:hypothetical protein